MITGEEEFLEAIKKVLQLNKLFLVRDISKVCKPPRYTTVKYTKQSKHPSLIALFPFTSN